MVRYSSGISDSAINAELVEAYNTTHPFQLQDFTYSNDKLLEIVFSHLENTSFEGVTVQYSVMKMI